MNSRTDLASNQPIFNSAWWLDATAGPGNWGKVELFSGTSATASFHWMLRSKFGFKILTQPPLTQTLGPWISASPSNAKYITQFSREKSLLADLLEIFPAYDIFQQSFAPEITNWLPFYWKGFQQTTYYTYRLHDLLDHDLLWSSFHDRVRTDIRKAKKSGVRVELSGAADDLLDLIDLTYSRQGRRPPQSRTFVKRLYHACVTNNSGSIYTARGSDGRPHAAIFIAWNSHCCYYLLGGGDPELRSSGATSLLIWTAIQHASTVSAMFDFEGSMINPIERFFRGFGAIQTPYSVLSHSRSRRVQLLRACRSCMSSLF